MVWTALATTRSIIKTKQSSEVVDGAIVPISDVHKEEQPLYNKLDIGFSCKTH